jgi:hypothetical protein
VELYEEEFKIEMAIAGVFMVSIYSDDFSTIFEHFNGELYCGCVIIGQ